MLQAASPLGFWWLPPATVYGLEIALIAAIYIGFGVSRRSQRACTTLAFAHRGPTPLRSALTPTGVKAPMVARKRVPKLWAGISRYARRARHG